MSIISRAYTQNQKARLKEEIKEIEHFILTSPNFKSLEAMAQQRWHVQLQTMNLLAKTLTMRLENDFV